MNTVRILLLFLLPLVAADCSKDTQNSQYSRTRNGEEEIQLFEGSHIGKMGGNFQVSPNIDTLAQRQMKGLAMTISQLGLDPHAIENGPVSDESGKSGSVYSLASARGSWKSGNSRNQDYGSDTYVQMNGWGETTYIINRDSSNSHQEKLSSGSSGVRYIPGSTVGPVTDVGGIARNRDKLGSEGQGSTMYNSGSRVAFTGRNYGASETYGESQLRRYKREIVGETYEAGTTRNKRYRKTGTFPWIFSNGTFDLRGGLIFCCQDDEQVVTTPKPLQRLQIPKGNNGVRISEQKCLEYSRRFCNTPIGCAGGGRPVRILGKYPHMAAVGWRKTDGSGFLWDCGGSLLSENYVLTAAHCTYHTAGGFVSERPDTVRLGELDFSIDDTAFQDIRIESIIMHPEYKSPSKYHDLALLKLATSARLTHYIRPVCLWQNETITRNIGHAMGWGSTSYLGNRSEVLQEVEISFYTNEECRESFGLSRTLERGVIPEQLCAGHPAGGRDTCKGDSGGPLTVSEEGNCIIVCVHHQVGITSFGKGCGSTIPAIYTRISSYLDWIEGVVWQ